MFRFDDPVLATRLPNYLLIGICLAVGAFALVSTDIFSAIVALSAASAAFIATYAKLDNVGNALSCICYLTALFAIAQFAFNVAPLAWTGNINIMGYVCSIGVMLSWGRRSYIALVCCALAVVISQCAGAVLVLCCYYGWQLRDHRLLLVFMFLAVGIVIYLNGVQSLQDRIVLFGNVLLSKPKLIGHTVVYWSQPQVWHSHNAILQSIIGLGVLPTMILSPVVSWYIIRSRLPSSALSFLVISSTIDYLYWWPGVSALVAMFLVYSVRNNNVKQCA